MPKSLGHLNHKMLAAYAFDIGSTDIAVTDAGVGSTPEDVSDYRAKIERNLRQELSHSTAETAVISSEDLSRLFSSHEIGRVIDLLREFCDELKIVVFVRRQDLLASSRYYSLLLGGSSHLAVLPSPDSSPPKYYDYNRNIGRWVDAVGPENIILARFPESPRSENFNSVDRFCEIIGINSANFTKVDRQHISFDAVNQIIIQNFNVQQGGHNPKELKHLLSKLSENTREYRHIPSQKQAQKFYNQYRESNESLFNRLGVSADTFTDDFSMYSENNMRNYYERIAIRRLLTMVTDRAPVLK